MKRIVGGPFETLVIDDAPRGQDDIVVGGIALSPFGARQFREALGLPDVTPEELRVVLAERKLEEARAEGVITAWHYGTYQGQYSVRAEYGGYASYEGNTRLAAAEAAAAECDRLRAERDKPKRPEVEEMDPLKCCYELVERGYTCDVDCGEDGQSVSTLRWHKGTDYRIEWQESVQTPSDYHRRALRRARALAGE